MSEEFKEAIGLVQSNPNGIQRVTLDYLEQLVGGKYDVLDPTNPFVFLLESACYVGSANIQQTETLTRRQYASLSQTEEELYYHMADNDYLHRFASPAETTFVVLLGLDELVERAVAYGGNKSRKIVIPRHSSFHVADLTFTMQYPIEVRILSHGGLQVVYDNEELSPVVSLESNVVDWDLVNLNGIDFIRMFVPVKQMAIKPYYEQLNISTGFNNSFLFEDEYLHARIYNKSGTGQWKEINTTHSDQVFDINQLTALLKVGEGALNVEIPQIYFNNNRALGELRIDIYSTKGVVDAMLGNYNTDAFGGNWVDLNQVGTDIYSAPLKDYSTISIYCDKNVKGGATGVDFDVLRERVINNALGDNALPITGFQLATTLENKNYTIKKDIDNITRRVYLASRELPGPSNSDNSAGAGCGIFGLNSTVESLLGLNTIMDNGNRITVTPDTLFELSGGVLQVVTQQRLDAISNMSGDELVTEINNNRYLYTPFHYVLDTNNNRFASRPYHLDKPEIESKLFVSENETLELQISTGAYALEKGTNGYEITLVTRSGQSFKGLGDDQINVQLFFRPDGEGDYAYVNGTLIGMHNGERVYRFNLDTTYDIDEFDKLKLTNFKLYDTTNRILSSGLTQDFEVMYSVKEHTPLGLESSELNRRLGLHILPAGEFYGVVQERLTVKFGDTLKGLWAKSRSVADDMDYLRWTIDVPMVYEQTVFKRDAQGNIELTYDDQTGDVTYEVLHPKDSPVLDAEGVQVYKHMKGDVKLDIEGNPIPVSNRKMKRRMDLFLIDGKYRFSTDSDTVSYRDEMAQTVVTWVNEDIASVGQDMLEQTELLFYPKSTIGDISVIVDESAEEIIESEQGFYVKYYMDKRAFNSLELRAPLTSIAIETIAEALKKPTVSMTGLSAKLAVQAGDDVLSVEVQGLGGNASVSTVTVKEEAANLTIRKKLETLPDGNVVTTDDVTVDFIQHLD